MTWLFITILAYFLFALANVGDKLMVSRYKTEPAVYAFYVGLLGVVVLFFLPFGIEIAAPATLVLAFVSGLTFVAGLYLMYKAILAGETTRAITIMGGSGPIFTLIFSYLFLEERLSQGQFIAFVFFILGIILISLSGQTRVKSGRRKLIVYALLAGLIFAISYVTAKQVYNETTFISGFFWIRIGGVIVALLLAVAPRNRQLIKIDWQQPKKQKGSLLLIIQIIGGLGVVCQNYAFSLASASLVNAMQAVQYATIFILSLILGSKIPQLKELNSSKQISQKIMAIILIGIGLFLLTIK